jgi:AraC-like DNA-binding protein
MDNPDLIEYIFYMPNPIVNIQTALLDTTLWASDQLRRRSQDLSPLYIHRYTGPRTTRKYGRHEFWEFTYVFHGRLEFVARGIHLLKPGAVVLIPPGMDHYEHSEKNVDTLWVGLIGERLKGLDSQRLLVGTYPELELTVERLWLARERARGLAGPELDALTTLVIQQFVRLFRQDLPQGLDIIDQAIGWLNRHFDRPLRVCDLAQRFGFSESYFHRAFKKHTGKSPLAYLTNLRVRHALQALTNTTMTIDQVARLVGFSDPLYFSRVVRKQLGQSPRQFRKRAD